MQGGNQILNPGLPHIAHSRIGFSLRGTPSRSSSTKAVQILDHTAGTFALYQLPKSIDLVDRIRDEVTRNYGPTLRTGRQGPLSQCQGARRDEFDHSVPVHCLVDRKRHWDRAIRRLPSRWMSRPRVTCWRSSEVRPNPCGTRTKPIWHCRSCNDTSQSSSLRRCSTAR